MKLHARLNRPRLLSVILLLHLTVFTSTALAENRSRPRINTTVDFSEIGDATWSFELQLPLAKYLQLKQNTPSALLVARELTRAGDGYVEDVTAEFSDSETALKYGFRVRGALRPERDGRWTFDMEGAATSLDYGRTDQDFALIAIADNIAHFTSLLETPAFGTVEAVIRVRVPEDALEFRLDSRSNKLSYRYHPNVDEGDNGYLDCELHARDSIMSSLAKVYGNPEIYGFWAARSVFRNTGDQTIRGLRIRHRVANLSSWSSWKKAPVVYPGQTVVEPFFPVFDIEKIAQFTSTRNAMVDVEYEYEMGGEKYRDSDSRRIQVLARNEVHWSSHKSGESIGFHERNDNDSVILGAFSNTNDPVVQQIAGAVSGFIGGTPPVTDESAKLYLLALWRFMELNNINYQLPPANAVNGKMVQHLKYARDVARNKSGTCASLAVFWASVCRSGGMKCYIVSTDQHAYPVFRLPESGELFAVEATMIQSASFEAAAEIGAETLEKDMKSGGYHLTDIDAMQDLGVHSLDLPPVGPSYLKDLGYVMQLPKAPEQSSGSRQTTDSGTHSQPKELVGDWVFSNPRNGAQLEWRLGGDGSFRDVLIISEERTEDEGTWAASESEILIRFDDGQLVYPYQLDGERLLVTLPSEGDEDPVVLTFFPAGTGRQTANKTTRETSASNDRSVQLPKSLIGKWHCDVHAQGGTYIYDVHLAADGTYNFRFKTTEHSGTVLQEGDERGDWTVDGNLIVLKANGVTTRIKYSFRNGYLFVNLGNNQMAYHREG